jgi:hypothetical protein
MEDRVQFRNGNGAEPIVTIGLVFWTVPVVRQYVGRNRDVCKVIAGLDGFLVHPRIGTSWLQDIYLHLT